MGCSVQSSCRILTTGGQAERPAARASQGPERTSFGLREHPEPGVLQQVLIRISSESTRQTFELEMLLVCSLF